MILLDYGKAPNALFYMARALLPKRNRRGGIEVPALRAIWRGFLPAGAFPSDVKKEGGVSDLGVEVHPVHLHAATMRLMMAMLTHPRFPLPIWNILQVRNRIVHHRPCRLAEHLDFAAEVTACRTLPKGAEFDIEIQVSGPDGRVLNSVSTFYIRGSFGSGNAEYAVPSPPVPPTTVGAMWSMDRRQAWSYARLTGDYNGIHWWDTYARKFGFPSAFSHPHRALAHIVERLPELDFRSSLQIDAWFKGPVYYGKPLELAWGRNGEEVEFALRVQGETRPAILGKVG